MSNNISLKTITDFLNFSEENPVSIFYIPAYQRGYRWQAKQVKELLDDLYSFACRKKDDGEFYCLQPLIVKRMSDFSGLPSDLPADISKAEVWEVIDGQQRLTTLRILYRYLMDQKGIPDNESLEKRKRKHLFHIVYESRKNDTSYIEHINANPPAPDHSNIDTDHMHATYREIERWIEHDAPAWSDLFGKDSDPESIHDLLFRLLNTSSKASTEPCGRIKFLWYELDPSSENAVKEFLDVNNGKIPLTDSELIKALFLKRQQIVGNVDNGNTARIKAEADELLRQTRWAAKWEQMENTLNDNEFWGFISDDIKVEDRMNLIFDMIYRLHHDGAKPGKGDIFRFYYQLLSREETDPAKNRRLITQYWDELVREFRLLCDWHDDAITYNLIGLLRREEFEVSLYDIRKKYDSGRGYDSFITSLHDCLSGIMEKFINTEDGSVIPTYKRRKEVRAILLFVNVIGMVKELSGIRNSGDNKAHKDFPDDVSIQDRIRISPPAYKFPFDLMLIQNWDVEHIDSATTNNLKRKEDKIRWISQTFKDLGNTPADIFEPSHELYNASGREGIESILNVMSNERIDLAIQEIRKKFESPDSDESVKDSIGNLTLLDYKTNREYGNSLYPVKRRKIFEAIKNGRYVPLMTRMVFSKGFSPDSGKLREWDPEDKANYHRYIYSVIESFIKDRKS